MIVIIVRLLRDPPEALGQRQIPVWYAIWKGT
jgi:hypothetical protein